MGCDRLEDLPCSAKRDVEGGESGDVCHVWVCTCCQQSRHKLELARFVSNIMVLFSPEDDQREQRHEVGWTRCPGFQGLACAQEVHGQPPRGPESREKIVVRQN